MAAGSVVLLHGLARTSDSMSKMNGALDAAGYHVCNISYPSRQHSIGILAKGFVLPAVRTCLRKPTDDIHFVTHSLGGIIVRQLARSAPDLKIGRVVMLSPPNHGSEVVDTLGGVALFKLINGPAGLEGRLRRDIPLPFARSYGMPTSLIVVKTPAVVLDADSADAL